MKYYEDEILEEIREYIESTYGQHYVTDKDEMQFLDYVHSRGNSEVFCSETALKYLARWGKKGGKNRKDLLKAIHYTVLLMHFSEQNEVALGEIPAI